MWGWQKRHAIGWGGVMVLRREGRCGVNEKGQCTAEDGTRRIDGC